MQHPPIQYNILTMSNKNDFTVDKQLETERIENKTVSLGKLPQDLWKSISAFSNADGGNIELGVMPDGTRIGIKPQFHDNLQRDVISLCYTGFNHKLYPEILVQPGNPGQCYSSSGLHHL